MARKDELIMNLIMLDPDLEPFSVLVFSLSRYHASRSPRRVLVPLPISVHLEEWARAASDESPGPSYGYSWALAL